ncbi:hypothetical protein HanPI659440_Chr11g0427881 [Helianthus annuus]|nr:hypothetical protein HanPI659440_Chr11g0427881 [Helianthus annuus]
MAYIDYGGPPEDIIKLVETWLKQRNLKGMLESFSVYFSEINVNSKLCATLSSSSDDEMLNSPMSVKSGRFSRSSSFSARITRMAEAIVCYPGTLLVAVLIQAIAHRVSYV